MTNKKFSDLPVNTNPPDTAVVAVASGGVSYQTPLSNVRPSNALLRSIYAQGTLTLAVQPTVGDTLTIGSIAYTFVSGSETNPGDVKLGANLAATQTHLVDVITTGSGPTASNTDVWITTFSGNTLLLTAQLFGTVGNSVATTSTFTSGSNFFNGVTLGTSRLGTDGTTTGGATTESLVVIPANPDLGVPVLEIRDSTNALVGHLDSDGGVIFANGNFSIGQKGGTTINYDSSGNPLVGNAILQFQVNNGNLISVAPGGGFAFSLFNVSPSDIPFSIFAYTDQTADILAAYDGVTFNKCFRVLPLGAIVTTQHAAPANGDLATGEMAIWFDQTAGASKLMIKAKNANGAVVTGSVNLA